MNYLMTTSLFFTLHLFTGCEGGFLLTKTSCKDGKIQSGSLCVDPTTTKASLVDCIDVDLSKVMLGSKVSMCDGSTGVGTYVAQTAETCTTDGQLGCLSSSDFPVVKKSALSASDIRNGKTIAGITGTKRDIKQCRNASNLSYFDTAPAASTMKIPGRISGFAGGNAVTMGWAHGLVLNDPIQLHCSGGVGTGLPGGAVFTGVTYYAIPATATDIRFQATPSGGALSVTAVTGCTATWVVAPVGDAKANNEDTIDDFNGVTATLTAPSSSPWGSDYLCNESNFVNVSGAAPFAPSNTTPTDANKSWSQIWRDELTGLLITNILYDAVPFNKDWYQLNAMCKSLDALNSGSGGTGWRLPTQKELLQLYIDGISKVSLAGGSTENHFWSSSGVSFNNSNARIISLSQASTSGYDRNFTGNSALCVR